VEDGPRLPGGGPNQIKSNQIKSNQIKSNQIKSNQIKSNQIKSNACVPEMWDKGGAAAIWLVP
jgi:hypothetical protein